MKSLLSAALLIGSMMAVSPAGAGEKTVKLAVEGLYCPSCLYIVRESIAAVVGVTSVDVSGLDNSATVIFDDEKTSISVISQASTNAGYPASLFN
ncbi:MAG: cation transporter [Hyphomicrobiales bacterium]